MKTLAGRKMGHGRKGSTGLPAPQGQGGPAGLSRRQQNNSARYCQLAGTFPRMTDPKTDQLFPSLILHNRPRTEKSPRPNPTAFLFLFSHLASFPKQALRWMWRTAQLLLSPACHNRYLKKKQTRKLPPRQTNKHLNPRWKKKNKTTEEEMKIKAVWR